MIFNTGKHKWHRTFLDVLNNHEIIYHLKHPRDIHYIIKPDYDSQVELSNEEYKTIINPMFNYLNGYTNPIKGYKNYTKSDFNTCMDLMNKFLDMCKKKKVINKLNVLERDFV